MTRTPRLLEEVRHLMRLHHYSIHTERAYCDWIKRKVLYHRMASRDDFKDGEEKIEQFLTHLAVEGRVALATQNRAMNALVFLYKKVLKVSLESVIDALRAPKKVNVPKVMTGRRCPRSSRSLCLTGMLSLMRRFNHAAALALWTIVAQNITSWERGDSMVPTEAGPGITDADIREENRRIRLLRRLVDFAMAAIAQSNLSHGDALRIVDGVRHRACDLFPGKEATFDLIYRPRFQRLIAEKYRLH
jgi:hypothetical protein